MRLCLFGLKKTETDQFASPISTNRSLSAFAYQWLNSEIANLHLYFAIPNSDSA